jgi:phage gpG-like protein
MASFTSLGAFAAHMTGMIAHVEHAKHAALEEAAKIVEKGAKENIGTYNLGWPQLAEATQKERVARGFSANDPLLRKGDLRDSIGHTVGHDEAHVGSNLDVAVWQELGTKRIPPRSFLMGTAVQKEDQIKHLVGHKTVAVLIKP